MESILHLESKNLISDTVTMSKKCIEKEVPLHWHDFFEIDIILDGEGYQNFNGTEHPLRAGTAYILKPTDFHGLHADTPLRLFNIMFNESILSDEFVAMLLNQRKNIVVQLSEEVLKKVVFITDMMLDEYSGNLVFRDRYIKNLMEALFFTLMRSFKPERIAEQQYDASVKKVLLYIHMHFRENPSLEKAATVAGFCPNYFSELFHKGVGCTYSDYLTNLKLEYAVRLLENSDITSTDLCFECGFTSVSNFLRAFKKRFGISPKMYARNYKRSKAHGS